MSKLNKMTKREFEPQRTQGPKVLILAFIIAWIRIPSEAGGILDKVSAIPGERLALNNCKWFNTVGV